MSYTHHFFDWNVFSRNEWHRLTQDFESAARVFNSDPRKWADRHSHRESRIPLQVEANLEFLQIVNSDGEHPGTCEQFILFREEDRQPQFTQSVTTQRCAYDTLVVATLVLAYNIRGFSFRWSSDGDHSDHRKGLRLAQAVGGRIEWTGCLYGDKEQEIIAAHLYGAALEMCL